MTDVVLDFKHVLDSIDKNVFRRWKKQFKKSDWKRRGMTLAKFLEQEKPEYFVSGAFDWHGTPQGFHYWLIVDVQYLTILHAAKKDEINE